MCVFDFILCLNPCFYVVNIVSMCRCVQRGSERERGMWRRPLLVTALPLCAAVLLCTVSVSAVTTTGVSAAVLLLLFIPFLLLCLLFPPSLSLSLPLSLLQPAA